MGRGHAYSYKHFMLIDTDFFMEQYEDGSEEFSDIMYDDFKYDLMMIISGNPINKYIGRDAYLFAQADDIELGIDNSGGLPCLFVHAREMDNEHSEETDEEIWDAVHDEVIRVFNEAIQAYPMVFRRATSAWTSEPIRQYG